jgi:hypothetical protein
MTRRSTWFDTDLKCVEISDVVASLQATLTELEQLLGTQKSQISDLQEDLKNDQMALRDLDHRYQASRDATAELLETHIRLEEHLAELSQQASGLGRERPRSLEETMALKNALGHLVSQCNDLGIAISRTQALSQPSRSPRTFLTITSDVQTQGEIAVPRLSLSTSQARNVLFCPESAVEIQRSDRTESGANRRAPVLTIVPKRRQSPSDDETIRKGQTENSDPEIKRSAEIKKLKASVKLLEQQVIQEKQRFVQAQAQVNQGIARNQNRNQSGRTQEELDESGRNYRVMKKKQREMEEEIRRLKEVHCGTDLVPGSSQDIGETLRNGLLFGQQQHETPIPWILGPMAQPHKPPSQGRARLLLPRA